MKLGILLSGGKDSLYAAYIAKAYGMELTCAISIFSQNTESYMFHTPHISGVRLQTEAMEIPLLEQETQGEKEKELVDLKRALTRAKEKYGIEGITTGAVASHYQSSRIQRICFELGLYCFNPLWQINELTLLEQLLKHHFEVIFTGVFAYPLGEEWLGKQLDKQSIAQLQEYQNQYQLHPAGEGGELESYVLDCPLFKKKISLDKVKKEYENYAGVLRITQAKLVEKEEQQIQFSRLKGDPTSKTLILTTHSHDLYEQEFVRPIMDVVGMADTKPLGLFSKEEEYEKIIITGCAVLDDAYLDEKKEELLSSNVPILGICAGASMFAQELTEQSEFGIYELMFLEEQTLIRNVSKEQYFMHHLSIKKLPEEFIILARSAAGISMFKHKTKEQYGVQFHPEVLGKNLLKKFVNQK